MSARNTPVFRVLLRSLAALGVACGVVTPVAGAEPATAEQAGFVDVRSVIPDAVVDLRYAASDNFVGKPLYSADAHCLVHESLAPGLATVSRQP